MRMRELIRKTGLAERQVRFLVAEGFVPPPRGGRANADYGEDHVTAILRYTRLKALGFPPAAIRLLLPAKAGAPIPIAPGITLVVESEQLGKQHDIAALEARVIEALHNVFRSPTQGHASDDDND